MNHKARKLYHSSIRIGGSSVVYIDPWKVEGEPHDADLILVTHDHFDHYSPDDIANIRKADTVLAVPESMLEQVSGEAVPVVPFGSYTLAGLNVETVPAYNIGRPFHIKEKNYVGYIVTVDGIRYYIAGDTDHTPDNENVQCDVALVPAGGKYTMDALQAAQLVNQLRPSVAIPTHYGTVTESADAADVFRNAVSQGITVEIHD